MMQHTADSLPASPSLVSKVTVAIMCTLAFLVSLNYALSRSSIENLYNHVWNNQVEFVWAATAFVVLVLVSIYNYFAVRYDLWRIFRLILSVSTLLLAILYWKLPVIDLNKKGVVYSSSVKSVVFLLCMWKDVYIVFLIEIFWTFANLVSKFRIARSLYGLFAFMGSFGDFVGNYISRRINTSHFRLLGLPYFEIWMVAPLLIIVAAISFILSQRIGSYQAPREETSEPRFLIEGIKIIGRSWYLLLLLLVIGVFQIGTGFLEKQLNVVLKPMGEAGGLWRTSLYMYVAIASMALGLLAPLLLRLFRAEGVMRFVPFLLLLTTVFYVFVPSVGLLSAGYALSKCTNYSIFRWTKEMFYLPLSRVEKIQGKAAIDMYTYRLGKALAAVLILPVTYFGVTLMWVAALLWVLWLLLNVPLIRLYRQRIESLRSKKLDSAASSY